MLTTTAAHAAPLARRAPGDTVTLPVREALQDLVARYRLTIDPTEHTTLTEDLYGCPEPS
ncbi:hypothetical protein ABZV80_30175 [Streptomyces sp. NPDC005132]|uniref:hypothetical protein n=1 Tax=Streptomyces sp. NPDC005132 TaxID=3154294 RepID=UPI0033B48BCF